MTIKATYIGKEDFTGFTPQRDYVLEVGFNAFTKQTIIYNAEGNLKAKFGSLKAFLLIFDDIKIITKPTKNDK